MYDLMKAALSTLPPCPVRNLYVVHPDDFDAFVDAANKAGVIITGCDDDAEWRFLVVTIVKTPDITAIMEDYAMLSDRSVPGSVFAIEANERGLVSPPVVKHLLVSQTAE